MANIILQIFVLVCVSFQVENDVQYESALRTWTSSDGNTKIEASLKSIDGEKIVLAKTDGSTITTRRSNLSEQDRQFLQNPVSTSAKKEPTKSYSIDSKMRSRLTAHRLRFVSGTVRHDDESKLSRALAKNKKLRKALQNNERLFRKWKQELQDADNRFRRFVVIEGELSIQLTNAQSVRENNRIVGLLNASRAEAALLAGNIEKMNKQLETGRSELAQQRGEFIQSVIAMRKLATEFQEQLSSLADDAKIQSILADLTKWTGEEMELVATRTFERGLKQLKGLEDKLLTEEIKLRPVGRSMMVNVSINGKHTTEMVLDTGASLITLPFSDAIKYGLRPSSDDPVINLSIADGSIVSGQLITIDTVRIGKFTIKDVECVVMGPRAVNAPKLLGMSFLENFKFDLTGDRLKLAKIESGE